MKILILMIGLLVFTSVSFAQEESSCEEQAPIPSEILKLAPVDVHIVLGQSSEALLPKMKPKSTFYGVKDLALDATMVGGIIASKPYMPEDKFKHLVAGAGIAYATTTIAKIYFRGQNHAQLKAVLAGFTAATLIGIAKELRDRKGYGTPDVKDAVVTSLGGAIVSVRFSINF